MSGYSDLNGRYVPDKAAITYRSGAVKKLNINPVASSQKMGSGRESRSRLCIQMSAQFVSQHVATFNVLKNNG